MVDHNYKSLYAYQDKGHWDRWMPLAEWLQRNKVAWMPDMEPLEGFLRELLTPRTAYALAGLIHQQWRQAVQEGRLQGDPALPDLACFEHQIGEICLGVVGVGGEDAPEPTPEWDNTTTAPWAEEKFSNHEDPCVRELWDEFKKLRDR